MITLKVWETQQDNYMVTLEVWQNLVPTLKVTSGKMKQACMNQLKLSIIRLPVLVCQPVLVHEPALVCESVFKYASLCQFLSLCQHVHSYICVLAQISSPRKGKEELRFREFGFEIIWSIRIITSIQNMSNTPCLQFMQIRSIVIRDVDDKR